MRGTVALIALDQYCAAAILHLTGIEQSADELDLVSHAWLFVMNVAGFDRSDCFNTAQGCLRRL
jgi:hypothetical protein